MTPGLVVRRLTPAGVGAVAVLHLAGRGWEDLLHSPVTGAAVGRPPEDGCRRVWVRDRDTLLDEALVVPGAEGIELHLHGGEGVVDAVLAALSRRGARTVSPDPGPVPTSLAAARAEASRRWGLLAALLEEVARVPEGRPLPRELSQRVGEVLAQGRRARALRRPAVVRLVGAPNAGKSTLFNALLARERALVSPRAGTTRDVVRSLTLVGGVPVSLEDTAGAPREHWEREGADLLVHVLQPDEPAPPAGPPPGDEGQAGPPDVVRPSVLRVRGKADRGAPAPGLPALLGVSGRTGEGLPALTHLLEQALDLESDPHRDVRCLMDPVSVRELQHRLEGHAGDTPRPGM